MKNKKSTIFVGFLLFILLVISIIWGKNLINKNIFGANVLNILSSNDNKDLESEIIAYAKKEGFKVTFTYMGDLDIVDELNVNSKNYDAVWISNSMWFYMLNDSKLTSESKSISISPVVMGIKRNKAKSLGLIGKNVTNNDILNLITKREIKYVMSSVTQTNDGATSYLGFLNSLAGSPEALKEEMLDDPTLINNMKNLFKGVERVSGDEDFLETMFINGDNYEAVIASESSLININKKLKESNKEELYLIYPIDFDYLNILYIIFVYLNHFLFFSLHHLQILFFVSKFH